MSISSNAREVRERVDKAAVAAGRRPEDIILVAASKMNGTPNLREAYEGGIRVFGENRIQEMRDKLAEGAYEGAELHFIGRLQKNKVKYAVGVCSLIHSVDSAELLEAISKRAQNLGIIQDILLEVNIGLEASKGGFAPSKLEDALKYCSALAGVRVRGLMCIPPAGASDEENRAYFSEMRQHFVDNSVKKYDNVSMDFLSMGMSGDFEAAIAGGSNMVRVGTAIFGERHYPENPETH